MVACVTTSPGADSACQLTHVLLPISVVHGVAVCRCTLFDGVVQCAGQYLGAVHELLQKVFVLEPGSLLGVL